MSAKKLYRYQSNKVIAGVCAGFSRYFDIDIVLVRLIWIVLAFTGIGIIAYIAAIFIIPYAPEEPVMTDREETGAELSPKSETPNRGLGILLIAIGVILLLYQFDVFNYLFSFHISWKLIWGLLLVIIGILLLFGNFSKGNGNILAGDVQEKILYRPSENRFFFGVCQGLALYFNIDVSLIRIFWVLATFASHGIGLFVYIVLIIIIPGETAVSEGESTNE